MRLLFLLVLLSLKVSATSCIVDTENEIQLNNQYSQKIIISALQISGVFEVSAEFPSTIKSEELSSVVLQLLTNEKIVFASQLEIENMESIPSVYFTVQTSLAEEAYIFGNYGEQCGFQIWKKVVFSDRV